jgi:hypothetical protein
MVKSEEFDFYEYCFQGPTISLAPANFDIVTNPTAFLLAAVDEFSPIFRPLTAELTVNCVDPEWRFTEDSMEVEQYAWLMYASWLPKHLLRNKYSNPVCEEVSAIAIAALSEWMQRACGQKCVSNPDYPVDWEDLWIDATCAQIFDVEKCAEKESLRMLCAETRNVINVPIRRDGNHYWVWGPDKAMQDNTAYAPFTVSLNHSLVRFNLHVNWSLWTDPASTGFQVICDLVHRSIDKGWKVSFAGEPFNKVFEVQPH